MTSIHSERSVGLSRISCSSFSMCLVTPPVRRPAPNVLLDHSRCASRNCSISPLRDTSTEKLIEQSPRVAMYRQIHSSLQRHLRFAWLKLVPDRHQSFWKHSRDEESIWQ